METENWDSCSNDSDQYQQDLRDEEESLYGSGLVSKLQFRKASSKARWNKEMGIAEVVERKGQIWNTTGIVRSGKLHCSIEETLYLMEIGALVLHDENDAIIPLEGVYQKLADRNSGCNWEIYEVYKHLKTLGYIVGRHDIPFTLKMMIKDSKNPIMMAEEQCCQNSSIAEKLSQMGLNESMPIFDIYLPNGKFKKSCPGEPWGVVCLTSGKPPCKSEVEALERQSGGEGGGVPLKFCHVESGRVSFFAFEKTQLPILP